MVSREGAGLFSIPLSEGDFTDEMISVDWFLKGIKDGGMSVEIRTGAKVTVPRKRLMNELTDVSEV